MSKFFFKALKQDSPFSIKIIFKVKKWQYSLCIVSDLYNFTQNH